MEPFSHVSPGTTFPPSAGQGIQLGQGGIQLGTTPVGLEPTQLVGQEQIGFPEQEEPQTGPDPLLKRPIISRTNNQQPNERLASYPDTFTELDLMPVRCYSCNKIFKQQEIEDSLTSGKTLKDTMDELDYARLCCRDVIVGAPGLVKLQKEINEQKQIESRIGNLTLSATEYRQPNQMTIDPTGFSGTESISSITIVDEAPPGTINQGGGICFTGNNDSFLDIKTDVGDSYEYFISQHDT